MKYITWLLILTSILLGSFVPTYAQQPELATYRETAHVLVDDILQNTTSAFITLSTVSNLEMRVPTDVENAIHGAQNVTSVRITNAPNCVFVTVTSFVNGKQVVPTQSCVIITIIDSSLIETHDIHKIQTQGQAIGDLLIGKIDKAFSIDTQPWEVYVRPIPKHELSATPATASQPSANASINVVYTFSYSKTSYLLDTLSSILLPKQIQESGGFYDAAKTMSDYNDSGVTFEILPQQNDTSLYQLQVARYYPITQDVMTIKPLELFGINKLDRSSYFSAGFFPLNSLVDVSVLSRHDLSIIDHSGNILPTTFNNGLKVPTDLTKPGWVFDPDSGRQIFAVYLFGTTTSATDNDLSLTLGTANNQTQNNNGSSHTPPPSPIPDYSTYIIIGIVAAGGAAVYLFMKRR
jgi:hypothetical protein